MEKYSQFRDRGSGISPFIPTTTPRSTLTTALHSAVFAFRLPFFITGCIIYFSVLAYLPLPLVAHKLLLWAMLGIPGIWWVDLQLDGVKRGSLSQQPPERFPDSGAVIAAQFTSPIDALYLSAIFDPIFTISYPSTRKVRRISLLGAILVALSPPATSPPPGARLTTIRALIEQNPHRVVAVFPEMTTTNGKGILPLSPSLLSAPAAANIFPVSLRYTPPDITTPVPGAYLAFLWNLLSRPTHCIRVRIAEGVTNAPDTTPVSGLGLDLDDGSSTSDNDDAKLTPEEQRVLDHIGEALARLARNKRVGLTLQDKVDFIEVWSKSRR